MMLTRTIESYKTVLEQDTYNSVYNNKLYGTLEVF